MVNTEVLIFSLISLIILIPIIYFLPLNLTKKGKITVVAVSFLIALAGLLTKVFMQLWQSILLLIGLILLLSMILTKKFSPDLFSVTKGSSNGAESDSSDDREKDKEISDFTKLESLPVKPSYVMHENAGMKNEPLGLEKLEDKTIVLQNSEGYMINELEDLQAFEKNEDKENDVIYPSDDAFFSPSLQSAASIENHEDSPLSHMELEEMGELAPRASEVQPEAENEEMAVNGDLSYLDDLEEFMFESQAEAAASSEILEEPETDLEPVFEQETEILLDDAADIENLLNNQLEKDTEYDKDIPQEADVERDVEQISSEVNPVLNELSDEDLQVVYNEEMELEEAIDEDPVVECAPENSIEDVQIIVRESENDWNQPVHENTIAEMEHPVLPVSEPQNPMETLEEIQEVVQEKEISAEELPAPSEDKSRTIEHREVFETLLLQASIAKKMQNKEQFEQIVESFLGYDDSDDERYKMLKTLLKDYINIMK
jgi:hypothetical protein